jgi:hypothetical protein
MSDSKNEMVIGEKEMFQIKDRAMKDLFKDIDISKGMDGSKSKDAIK